MGQKRESSSGVINYEKVFTCLGFVVNDRSDNEIIGDCVFCGKHNKMYVNITSGQWLCHHAACAEKGNMYTYLSKVYEIFAEDIESSYTIRLLSSIARKRHLKIDTLVRYGLAWDGENWVIPSKNIKGKIVNLNIYRQIRSKDSKEVKRKWVCVSGLKAFPFNIDSLINKQHSTIYICEGIWDALALNEMIFDAELSDSHIAISFPGATTFKPVWAEYLVNNDIVICYDNDDAGIKGTELLLEKFAEAGITKNISKVVWPNEYVAGSDINDLLTVGKKLSDLQLMIHAVSVKNKNASIAPVDDSTQEYTLNFPTLKQKVRPTFYETLEGYKKWLFFTPEMERALRIIFATIYSNQIPGDPLWVHIVSPPGTGKSELLMSTSESNSCVFRSSVTAASLVSGWKATKNDNTGDPSLIPKAIGKTLILKDFTEVLKTPKDAKETIFSILRGAYDGVVERSFGNGVNRIYYGYFNLITGVTQAIFSESTALMGERFLIYHMVKGVGFRSDHNILAALQNVGDEPAMKQELCDLASNFIEYKLVQDDIPSIPEEYLIKLVNLSQLVSMLRSHVERDRFNPDKILYRPQHEVGTRLAKQLKKLMIGLAITETPIRVTEECYKIVAQVALDTCIGFNLEIIEALIKFPNKSSTELMEMVKLPYATIREQVENMYHLGVLSKSKTSNPAGKGAPLLKYTVTDVIKHYWVNAGLLALD